MLVTQPRSRLGDFLRARRAVVHPDDVGLYAVGARRVAGLRRDELADLAGVSTAYLKRLEQGHDQHPSEQVLLGLARALLLDAAGTSHLLELGGHLPAPAPAPAVERAADSLVRLLDASVSAPAFVVGRALDVLAANPPARRLHPSFRPGRNVLRDAFLDETAAAGYADVEQVRDELVASLQANATGPGGDVDLLAVDLAGRSRAFARRWQRHDVRRKADGAKSFVHPDVGRIDLDYDTLSVEGVLHQRLIVYSAPAGSKAAGALERLAADRARLRVVEARQAS